MAQDKDDPIMIQLLAQLSEAEVALDTAEAEITRWTAEAAGFRAKRDSLSEAIMKRKLHAHGDDASSAASSGAIPDLRSVRFRKSAILTVLQVVEDELHIDEVIAKLREGGRDHSDDWYAVVAATLNHLVKEGKVINTRRGYYKAA